MLYQTKYGNNIREVSGVVTMFQDDVILEVNTSLVPCTINLNQIPPSNWNTIYKVYIYDISNNAATNNITINAFPGQTINGQPSITISGNGGAAIIRVLGEDRYGATLIGGSSVMGHIIEDEGVALPQRPILNFEGPGVTASDGGGKTNVYVPGGVLSLTNAAMNTLITNNQVVPGQLYGITDAIFITNYFAIQETVPVIVTGTSTNSVSLEGEGIFLNADYQQVGDYSGVPGFVSNIGVWNAALVPVVGNVVMWANKHYVNTTGVNTATAPSGDPVNWTELVKGTTTGYIQEVDFVTYDVRLNVILSRKDKRNNYVENNFAANTYRAQTFNVFQWGNNKVAYNIVTQNSVLVCYQNQVIGGSLPNVGDLGIYGNTITNDSFIELSDAGNTGAIRFNKLSGKLASIQIPSANVGYIEYNDIVNSSCQFSTDDSGDLIQNNYILNSSVVCFITNNLAGFLENEIKDSNLTLSSLKGLFNRNVVDRSAMNITLADTLATITGNTFINTSVEGTITSNVASLNGIFRFNKFDSAFVKLDSLTADSVIEYNVVTQGSWLSVASNEGRITYNQIENLSRLVLGSNNGNIGQNVKDTGNRLSNQTKISIGNNSAKIYNSVFDQRTEIDISGNNTGDFYGVFFKTILISCVDQNGIFSNLDTDFGTISTTTITRNYANGSCIRGGYNSITAELDLTDPTIYDLPTKTLTIPAETVNFAGKYLLKNAAGQQIDLIYQVDANWLTEFYCDANTIVWNAVSITPHVPQSIVWNAVGLITMNGRVAPQIADSVIMQGPTSGTVNAITEIRAYI